LLGVRERRGRDECGFLVFSRESGNGEDMGEGGKGRRVRGREKGREAENRRKEKWKIRKFVGMPCSTRTIHLVNGRIYLSLLMGMHITLHTPSPCPSMPYTSLYVLP